MPSLQPALRKRTLFLVLALFVLAPLLLAPARADAAPTELFFSEYVEGTSNNKAVEIFNGTGAAVDLAAGGYAVQMCFNGNPVCSLTIPLTGTVAAGDVHVLAQAAADPAILAQADQTNGAGWFNGDDAVLLVKAGATVDAVGQQGFDPGTEWGTGLASTADNTLRRKPTVQAGDPEAGDAFDPALQWDGFATDDFAGLGSHTIAVGDAPPSVTSASPTAGATQVAENASIEVTFSEDVTPTGDWFSISCASSGSHSASVGGGPRTFTLDPSVDFASGETCTVSIAGAGVSDVDLDDPPDTMAADFAWSFTTLGPPARIHEIQDSAHLSPLDGSSVSRVPGIVTAKVSNGFFLQDSNPDEDPATSEGIFVFGTAAAAGVAVGDAVLVNGIVDEFRPGGASTANLTTTEIASPSVTVLSSGNALPAPTVVGVGGRRSPSLVIEDDAAGSVESSGVFDPAEDGIDFYESLEAMLVQVNDALAVGPTNEFGEIPVVGDGGARAGLRTDRDGVVIRSNDFNPERIHLDDRLRPVPLVDVGDGFPGALVGVMDYSFGNFKLDVTGPIAAADGGLQRETTRAPRTFDLAVAAFNVENLDPGDPPAKFAALADVIVGNLQAPDLIALEEVQDSNGPVNDSTTDATLTYQALIAAIQAAGGPLYEFRQIDPVDDQDGGEPGGNIRVGFLFRTDRGLQFVDRPGGTATAATGIVRGSSGPQLTFSPGRIDPANPAFANSRKPLAGEFRFRGRALFVIANHFNSKNGDDPLFGHVQPPVRRTEEQRHQQAQIVNRFVRDILARSLLANVIVLGDLNDFEFSETLEILQRGALVDLVFALPKRERYTYVFEGNSQVLDHILVSPRLLLSTAGYDIVHVNAEFAERTSDHDPQVARFAFFGGG